MHMQTLCPARRFNCINSSAVISQLSHATGELLAKIVYETGTLSPVQRAACRAFNWTGLQEFFGGEQWSVLLRRTHSNREKRVINDNTLIEVQKQLYPISCSQGLILAGCLGKQTIQVLI